MFGTISDDYWHSGVALISLGHIVVCHSNNYCTLSIVTNVTNSEDVSMFVWNGIFVTGNYPIF